jgi:hypothetical protein
MGSFYVYLIMAFSIVDEAKRHPQIFILHSSIITPAPEPWKLPLDGMNLTLTPPVSVPCSQIADEKSLPESRGKRPRRVRGYYNSA